MGELDVEIRRKIEQYPPAARKVLLQRLERVLTRESAIRRFPTPAHLSQFWRPEFVQTPMLDAIDEAIMRAERGEQRRLIINTPPQRGKTSRIQDGAGWMLLRNPALKIVFASYEQGIAGQSTLAVRQMIETHGSGYGNDDPFRVDVLGLQLDPVRAQQTRWSLADVPGNPGASPGGMSAVGVGGALTGRPADVIFIDDPIKDQKQADSDTIRRAVIDWYQSVVLTRLSRNGVIIVVQTRWHEKDLSGWLLKHDDQGEWGYLNIPAQAESDDPLGRQPGEYLVDTRGFTPDDWKRVRREVGERTWNALYQGRPTAPEGGIFKRSWLERHRAAAVPDDMSMVTTFVDPADNLGDGDEAGIVTAGIGPDRKIYVIADDSGHYTVAQWYRRAIFSLLDNRATKIEYEKSLSGLDKSMRTEWRTMRKQAATLRSLTEGAWPAQPNGDVLLAATQQLAEDLDTEEDLRELEQQLRALFPYVPGILRLPETGPTITGVRAEGSKAFRAQMVAPLYENGTARHVGHLPELEHQQTTWLPTKDSPDRMDAAVHVVRRLFEIVNADTSINRSRQNVASRTGRSSMAARRSLGRR